MADRGRGKWRTACVAIVALALGAAFGPGLATGAVETFKDVVVKNTTANPVPTSAVGTTQVAGKVGLDSAANDVEITNPQLVNAGVNINLTDGNPIECKELLDGGQPLRVPLGKRLVLEYASAQVSTPADRKSSALISISTTGGSFAAIPLQIAIDADSGSIDSYVGSEKVHMFAGQNGGASACARSPAVDLSARIDVSGHLEDIG